MSSCCATKLESQSAFLFLDYAFENARAFEDSVWVLWCALTNETGWRSVHAEATATHKGAAGRPGAREDLTEALQPRRKALHNPHHSWWCSEKSGGCKFGIKEAPDWWSEALAVWANNQRTYGKAFKKPASKRSPTEKRNAGKTTRRRVALLDGIGLLT